MSSTLLGTRVTGAILPDFLDPERLWLLLIVVALGAGYVASLVWRKAAQVRFTQVDLLDRVAPKRPHWRRHVVAALQLLGLAVAVIAIARPVEHTSERTRSEGRILVLFDVSLSMEATDVAPNRLEAAKVAARDFIDEVDDDVEVGLVSFAGVVRVQVEPTLDRDRVNDRVDGLELDESTAIGDAIIVSTNLLTDAADDQDDESAPDDDLAPGAIVLLTDGETTIGQPTIVGAEVAADAGVPVFTIAFGTADGFITDPINGEIYPVPVVPDELETVAEMTGGQAYEAQSGDALADAYDEVRDSLGDTLGEEIEITKELTWRWALAAFLLLTAAWSLSLWWLRGMV
ncbi:VWA domain-containing protein [Ilumatobacter nonamiensis]|uniref:VWA domain-containing protein n=1 Tax=Ilumatobacter nonamiensis TaxID=467093 RepID=UPI000688C233|nr:VWA domain-containing protein [Ilumatobacter nonamiensis]